MKRTIGTGWAVGAVVLTVIAIVGTFVYGNRPSTVRTIPVQTAGRPIPAQPFIPAATGP